MAYQPSDQVIDDSLLFLTEWNGPSLSLATHTRTWIVYIRSTFWASGYREWTCWDPELWLWSHASHGSRYPCNDASLSMQRCTCESARCLLLICFVFPGGVVLAHGGRWVHRAHRPFLKRSRAVMCRDARVPGNHRPIHAPARELQRRLFRLKLWRHVWCASRLGGKHTCNRC